MQFRDAIDRPLDMTDPYRDHHLSCPGCNATLREFRGRYVCDKCDGMLLGLPDLAHAIHDMTSVEPAFEFRAEKTGKRGCPLCTKPMTICKLTVMFDGESLEPKPTLDRCDAHGLWFDGEELAGVFEKVATKGYGGGVGRKRNDAWGAAIPASGARWEWEGSLGTTKK